MSWIILAKDLNELTMQVLLLLAYYSFIGQTRW